MPYIELNFTFGATLTSSEMNALHENYAATFAGNSGSPVSKFKAMNLSRTDLTRVFTPGYALVLSEGMYSYIGRTGNVYDTNITRLEYNDGSSWHHINQINSTSLYPYTFYGSGLFMTHSNNFRVYCESDGVTSSNSPVIYRYD